MVEMEMELPAGLNLQNYIYLLLYICEMFSNLLHRKLIEKNFSIYCSGVKAIGTLYGKSMDPQSVSEQSY